MVELLLTLLVLVVVLAVCFWLIGQLGLPAPTQRIITVILVAIALVVVIVRFLAPLLRA